MRIDSLVFGYRRVKVAECDLPRAATALLRFGICADISPSGEFDVPLHRVKRVKKALTGIDYELSEIKSFVGFLFSLRKKYGAIAALLLVSVLFALCGNVIWDVRIEGNGIYTDSELEAALDELGLSVGRRWSTLDLDKTETEALRRIDGIGWINVNRRGTVAYVKIKEKTSLPVEDGATGYCNIVAAEDCVIEEITVVKGIAAVKAGDTVRAGDLLISGVIPAELGGGFVKAEGTVTGRVERSISVRVERTETKRVISEERVVGRYLKIFGFSLNILKKGGNSQNDYDIIEDTEKTVDKKNFSVFGKYKLPIELITERKTVFTVGEQTYRDAELAAVAAQRLTAYRAAILSGSELIGISTHGEYTDEGYTMTSDVRILADVGEERFFG